MDNGDSLGSLLALSSYVNPGSVSLMAFAFVTGAWGKWVFGWVYDAKCRENDKWRELALNGNRQAKEFRDLVA